jgi:hypothetical protein
VGKQRGPCIQCGTPIGRQSKAFCSKECMGLHHRLPLAGRFWKKVLVRGGKACWEWTGSLNPAGYGQISISNRPRLAHRVSWEQIMGPIPAGMLVCHHCDNPRCVRPSHLFIGTFKDNAVDASRKGRLAGNHPPPKPYIPVAEKRCPRCEQVRRMEAFSKNRTRRDGRMVYCRDCMKEVVYLSRQKRRTA